MCLPKNNNNNNNVESVWEKSGRKVGECGGNYLQLLDIAGGLGGKSVTTSEIIHKIYSLGKPCVWLLAPFNPHSLHSLLLSGWQDSVPNHL